MVPNGWISGVFSDGVQLISGQHVEAKFVNCVGEGKPYLTGPADFPNGKIIVTKFTNNAKKECLKGDLLITVKGSGTGKVIEADESYAISRQLMAIRATSFDSRFCFYNLVSSIKRYEGAASGLIPGISREDVLKTPVMIPPLPEQQKIASILSAWDKAISTTERLIDNSKQQKKALMQQLLTGKKRLLDDSGKPFEGKWEEVKLGDISHITTGSSNREDSTLVGEYAFFDRSIDIRTSSQFLFDGEAIIVPGEGQEFIPKYFNGKFDLHQRTYAIMNLINSDGKFLFYSLSYFSYYLLSQAVGSTVKSLRLPMFQKMPIRLPSLLEQQKIAAVLTNADKEIDLLEKQLADLKQEKKSLMQQLLTGKRRVKVDDKEVA